MLNNNKKLPPKVIIIILNWNGKQDSALCLESLKRIVYPNYHVILVDNASTDGSEYFIRASFPWVEVIQTGANLGFAGGNNIGIRRALELGTDYMLLLNNDTEVDPNILSAFLDATSRNPEAAAFSGKIYYHSEPNRIWYAGAEWLEYDTDFSHIGGGRLDDGRNYSDEVATAYACGCAFFVSSYRIKEIGLLDERYFLTYEETDWCYRARQKGYQSIFVPRAMIWHKISSSFGGSESPIIRYYLIRNKLLWAQNSLPLLSRLRLYKNIIGELNDIIIPGFVISREPAGFLKKLIWSIHSWIRNLKMNIFNPYTQANLMGLRDFFLNRFGECPKEIWMLNDKKI